MEKNLREIEDIFHEGGAIPMIKYVNVIMLEMLEMQMLEWRFTGNSYNFRMRRKFSIS